MDGLSVILNEVSQRRNINIKCHPLYVDSKKKKKNDTIELTKQKEAHRLKEQIYGCPGGRTGEMDS